VGKSAEDLQPDVSSARDASAACARQRRLTVLGYSCLLLVGINAGWIGPFLPAIAHATDLSIDRAGLIVSASAAGYFVALLAAGEMSQHLSARTTLACAMVLLGAGLFGLGVAPGLAALLGAAVVIGFGCGGIDVADNALVAELNRERLGSALNYLHVMFGVGALLGPLIVGAMLAARTGYPFAFAAGALVSLGIAALLWATPLAEPQMESVGGGGLAAMLSYGQIWVLGAILLLYVGAESGIGAWLFVFLRSAGGLSDSPASWGVSVYWLGLIAGRMVGGRLGHAVAPREFSIGAAALSAAAIVGLIAAPAAHWLAALMAFLVGAGFGPIFPNMIAIGAEIFPTEVGRMTSVVAAGSAIGGMIVPWMMGRALVAASPSASMEVALAVTVLMGALCVAGLPAREA
jgi:fucose permease